MEKCLNKTIVVTGGAEGIGLSIAKKFLENEAKLVILLDINEEKGKEAVKEITSSFGNKAIFIKCNVTEDLEAVFEEITSKYSVEVLINNAGISDDSVPKIMIDVNLTAAIEWSLKFWDYMKDNDIAGTIINVSSVFGFRISPISPIYHATKFGLAAFSRSLGHEYRYKIQRVRVITLCPGFTETNMSSAVRNVENDGDFIKMMRSYEWQSASVVGDAAVDVFERAASGSVWSIEGGKLKEEIFEI